MNSFKRMACFCVVFACLLFTVDCITEAARQPEADTVEKTELEQKAEDAERIKQRREAAEKAKREAAEKEKAKREEQARLAKLDAQAQAKADEKIAEAKSNKQARLAALDPNTPKQQLLQQKKQIEAEYAETVAKIKLELKYQRQKTEVDKLALLEDTTIPFTVKQLRITGNELVSTAELLEKMPLVYNASELPLDEAAGEDLYDFRVLIETVLNPGEPHQVSARTIQGLVQYVLSVYQGHNYAGIYVYVPAEAMIEGKRLQDEILPIEILEAEVTNVTVTQYDPNQNKVERGYLLPSAVKEWSPVKPGQVANQKKMDDFVNLLNLNPDRYVSAVVTKGAKPKTLDVTYDIYEADPWHWFWQIDNSGTRDKQWVPRLGFINTNLLGIDDTFVAIYQAPWDATIDDDYSIYGSYDFPLLGPKLRLNTYAGYSQYDISPESGTVNFLGNGHFFGGTLRYNALQAERWFFDVLGSFSYERSKVTPSLFPSILGTDIKMWLWSVGVNLHRSDDVSNTSITLERTESMQGGSDKEEFTLARTNATPDFTIYTAAASHSQYIDPNKIERVSATFRWIGSNKRLVPAKMTTFGGMYTVRGYEEYEIVGDGGLLASFQYEFDLVKHDQVKQNLQDEAAEYQPATIAEQEIKKLAPLVFFDYGRSHVKHPAIATEKAHVEMFSAGVGMVTEIGDNFSGGVYYGYPLRATDNTRTGKGRVNVSLMMRW